ncbi:hypothetical protein Y032_0417g1110 [Ancylostoma ceylanicum]|uniref:Pepsin inhibitor-3-like repeated domain-containing protein n=1 Tax=Ancylostoma ceylanicum TaxID=53326 RepID=A0A016X1J6_9BILA|nr:hypothetical protein Y032_0417g1110 [Ancylostoma ceylanicum]
MGGSIGCVVTKISDALENADLIESTNTTVPQMPAKPAVPAFCSGKDTTIFIFGGCTVQNYKVYIGKTLARDLKPEEKDALDDFAKKKAQGQQDISSDLHQRLDFCTELS